MKNELIEVQNAWKEFIINGRLTGEIKSGIKNSWKRCSNYNLNPLQTTETPVLPNNNLKERFEKHERLLRIADPVMKNLYRTIKGSNFLVLLADHEGYIIKSVGENEFKNQARNVHLIAGADWSEGAQGTNAIGTVVEEKTALNVHGGEHFFRRNHILTCSAAPIFSPDNELLGVLDISGNYQNAHIHTLGVVEAAALLIQRQMQILQLQDELQVSRKKERLFFNLVSAGLININNRGIITRINQKGGQLLGYSARDCVGKRIDELMSSFNNSALMDIKENRQPSGTDDQLPGKNWHLISSDNQITDLIIQFNSSENSTDTQLDKDRTVFSFRDIIGESEAITESIRLANKVATGDSTILLLGESGTGKELFAQAIHNKSFRQEENFITVNCGALPKDLIESELFGYQEGAFTGARRGGKTGKFQQASGGTIFLDEIAELPLDLQVKLLRVLQEKKISPLGSEQEITVDIRVIAATNRDLKLLVDRGEFRKDLYYRLNVIQITIPPLRQRRADILPLAQYFLRKLGQVIGKTGVSLAQEVEELFQLYNWPGNVRELENIVERALNLCEGNIIKIRDLPEYMVKNRQEASAPGRIVSLQEAEVAAIKKALDHFDGNITQTARHLQIARNTLYRKIREYDIEI